MLVFEQNPNKILHIICKPVLSENIELLNVICKNYAAICERKEKITFVFGRRYWWLFLNILEFYAYCYKYYYNLFYHILQ